MTLNTKVQIGATQVIEVGARDVTPKKNSIVHIVVEGPRSFQLSYCDASRTNNTTFIHKTKLNTNNLRLVPPLGNVNVHI